MFRPQKGIGRGTKDVRFALDPALWGRAQQFGKEEGIEVQEVMRQALVFALDNTTIRTLTWDEAWREHGSIMLDQACATIVRTALSGGKDHPFHFRSNPLPRQKWDRSQIIGSIPMGLRVFGYPWHGIVVGMLKESIPIDEVVTSVWNAMRTDAAPERMSALASELVSAIFMELPSGEESKAAAAMAQTVPVELLHRVAKQLEGLPWGGQERSAQWVKLLKEALPTQVAASSDHSWGGL